MLKVALKMTKRILSNYSNIISYNGFKIDLMHQCIHIYWYELHLYALFALLNIFQDLSNSAVSTLSKPTIVNPT